jgi:hypothetical protein
MAESPDRKSVKKKAPQKREPPTLLTTWGETRITTVITQSPWTLPACTLVIPVSRRGEPVGDLAFESVNRLRDRSDLAHKAIERATKQMKGKSMRPNEPQSATVASTDSPPDEIYYVIFATAFAEDGLPTAQNARQAAVAAVRLAAGLPSIEERKRIAFLPFSGDRSDLSPADISQIYNEALNGALEPLPLTGIEEITFVITEERYAQEMLDHFQLRSQRLFNDLAQGDDLLGVQSELAALAEGLLLRDQTPPLVVGVLGGWGSGKTFAMRLMQEEMSRIRALPVDQAHAWPPEPLPKGFRPFPYVGHVYTIHFDAWTYAKSDLWASLMQTILLGLNQQLALEQALTKALPLEGESALLNTGPIWRYMYSLSPEHRAALLESPLGQQAVQAVQAALRQPAAGGVESELWGKLEELRESERDELKKSEDNLKTKRDRLDDAQRRLQEAKNTQAARVAWQAVLQAGLQPLSGSATERLQKYLELNGDLTLGDVNQLLTLAPTLKDIGATLLKEWYVYAGFALFIAGTLLVPALWDRLESLQLPGFWTATISSLLAILKVAKEWRETLLSKWADYQKRLASQQEKLASETDPAVSQRQKEVEQIEEEVKKAEEEVALRRERLGLTGRYRSLNEFIEERLRTGAYEKVLGPMHQIQQDIKALTTDLVVAPHDPYLEKKKALFPRGPARVVLFIDDLDRCPPDKVVEMLEAIQILIKTPLFTVVMAIDVRFITRALEKAYADILTRRGDPSGLDYIEKIIQIPYRVRPISSDAVRAYLEAQMSVARPQAQPEEESSADTATSSARQLSGQPTTAQEAAPTLGALPARAIDFSEDEFDYVLRCCGRIDLTPRAAKRLVNVCKTLKIVWFRPNQHREPDLSVKQAAILFLALSGRYPDLMRQMFQILDAQVKQGVSNTDATSEHKLVELFHANRCGQDAYIQQEYDRLLKDVDALMPPDLTVSEIPPSTLDLVRSFSFVGDVGYIPGDDESTPGDDESDSGDDESDQ